MANGKEKNIDPGLIDLVSRGALETVRGVLPSSWFGPGQPLLPVAPPDTALRTHDYTYGVNQFYQPRVTESGVTYDQLRSLAETYDILRLVIETRKDQVAALPWSFRVRPADGETKSQHAERNQNDPRIKKLNEMFRYPDGEHDFETWIRAALEDVFVVDALSIAPRWSDENRTEIVGLDIIDGATISRKIDISGRTPLPPSVAYQQVLKGVPAIDLTMRDLIYRPRNYRAHRIYGFSPVEQIIITVNTALRRQQTQLQYYTEGNVPEAIASVPDTWSPDQIKNFQDMFDVLAGNTAKKQRVRFVPQLDKLILTKDKDLKDDFDEWLARVICFAFSINPQPFVKMMNRATAQNASEAAMQEGLMPLLDYISGVLSFIVQKYMDMDDVEFGFLPEEEADQLKQAQIDKIYASYSKESVDEQRTRDGQDPIGIGPMCFTATGPIPMQPFMKGGAMSDGLPQHTNPVNPADQIKPEAQEGEEQPQEGKEEPEVPAKKMRASTFKKNATWFRRKWSY